jgi:thioredoxin reductase (NADPH)
MYDVLIIGAGPGGMTAAIYTQRANLKTAMIEKAAPGGYMLSTWEIENYAGVGVVSGFELSDKMFKHTQELGAEYLYGDVTKIESEGKIKKVHTADGNVYEAKAVIIGSGMVPRKVGAPNEDKFTSKGISWCAVCDGAFFKNQHVMVLGGGNSAIDEAIYLTTMNVRVTVVNILPDLQADKGTIEKAKKNDMIDFILGHEVVSFNGDDKLSGVTIKDVETNEEKDLDVQGAFIFIGHLPNSEFVRDLGITDERGFIKTDENMATAVPGIYAIGDVIQKNLRQIVTAAADGSIASQQVSKYVESLDD